MQLNFQFCLRRRKFQKRINSTLMMRTNHVLYKVIIFFRLSKSQGCTVTQQTEIQSIQILF